MKCTKTFTLEIVVTATCPVFDAELDLLAAPVDQGAFAAYADSATPGVPHKYFASFGTNLVVINADTQALIATDPNPGAYSSYNDATVGQASSRLYRFLWNGLAVFVDAMDIDTYAHTTTASLGVGWTGTHLVYEVFIINCWRCLKMPLEIHIFGFTTQPPSQQWQPTTSFGCNIRC